MKQFCCLFLFFSLVLFASCKDDEVDYGLGEYYEELATVESLSSFRLDNGTLLSSNQTLTEGSIDIGSRVFLMFSYTNESAGTVNLHSISKVNLGELQALSKDKIDERPTDPIRLESVWTGSRYLNMQFYIDYHSEAHSIMLACNEEEQEKDNIDIYFRHDTNDDPAGAPVRTFLSFDLSKVLGQPSGKRTIRVHINSSNYGNKAYTFVY